MKPKHVTLYHHGCTVLLACDTTKKLSKSLHRPLLSSLINSNSTTPLNQSRLQIQHNWSKPGLNPHWSRCCRLICEHSVCLKEEGEINDECVFSARVSVAGGWIQWPGYSLQTLSQQQREQERWRAKSKADREGDAYSHTNRWDLPSSSQYLLFLNKKIGSISLADSEAGSGSIMVCVKEA